MNVLELAIKKAGEIAYIRGRQRHFAFVVDKANRIVGKGSNSYVTTHPLMLKAAKRVGLEDKCYIHAELAALISDKHRKGIKLVVARVNSKGDPVNSEPCIVCKELLRSFPNIKSIEYST